MSKCLCLIMARGRAVIIASALFICATLLYGNSAEAQECSTGEGGTPLCTSTFNPDNPDLPAGCRNGTSTCVKVEGCETRVAAIQQYMQMIGNVVYGTIGDMRTDGSCPGVPATTVGMSVNDNWGVPAASIMRCGVQTISTADCYKSIWVAYVAAIDQQCSTPIDSDACRNKSVSTNPECIRPACKDLLLWLAEGMESGEFKTAGKQLDGSNGEPCIMPFNADGSLTGCSFDPSNFPPLSGGTPFATARLIGDYVLDRYINNTAAQAQGCFLPNGEFSEVATSGAIVGTMGAGGSCYGQHYAMVLGRDACGNTFTAESTVASGFSCYSTNAIGTTSGGGPGINWMGCKGLAHYNGQGNCFAYSGGPFGGGCVAGCAVDEPTATWYYEIPNSTGNPPTEEGMCGVATAAGCCPVPPPVGAPTGFPPTPTTEEELAGWPSGTAPTEPNVPSCRQPTGPGAVQPLRAEVIGAKGMPDSHFRKKTDVINPYEIFFHKDFYHSSNYTSACYYFNNLLSRVIKGIAGGTWNPLGTMGNYKCGLTGGYDPATGLCFGGREPIGFSDYDHRLGNINWLLQWQLQKAGDDQANREGAYELYNVNKEMLETSAWNNTTSEIMEYLRRLEEQNKEYGVETASILNKFTPFLGACPGLTARQCYEKFMQDSGCASIMDVDQDFVDDLANLGCNDDDIAIRMGGKRNELPLPRVKGKLLPGTSHEEVRRLTIACSDHVIRSLRMYPPARPGTVLENIDPANKCYKLEGQDRADCYARELCQPLRIMSKQLYEKSMGFSPSEHWPPGYCRITQNELDGNADPTNASGPLEYYTQRIQVADGVYPQRIMEPEPSAYSAESIYYDSKAYPKRDVKAMNEGWRDYREWLFGSQELETLKDMPGTLCFPRPTAVLAKVDSVKGGLKGSVPEPNSTEMPETRESRGRTKTNLWPRTDHSDAFSPRHQEDKFEYTSPHNDPLDMYPVCFVCGGNFQFQRNMMTPMVWEIEKYARCIDCIRWCKNYYNFDQSFLQFPTTCNPPAASFDRTSCLPAWRETEDIKIGKAVPYGDCCTSGGEGYCGESFVNTGPYTYSDPICHKYEHINGNFTIDPINLPKSWFCHQETYSGVKTVEVSCTRQECYYETPTIYKCDDVTETTTVEVPWECHCSDPAPYGPEAKVSNAIECKECNPRSVKECCAQNISPKVFEENLLNLAAFDASWGNETYNQARITPDKLAQRLPYGGPDFPTKEGMAYPVPEGFSFHEEFGRHNHCKEYNKRYRSDWCAIKSDANVPNAITGSPMASERRMPWLQWYQLNEISCKGDQDSIVGVGDMRQNCGYGGWEELKLYQLRCFRVWGVDCICDYEKTFKVGSSEEHVLKEAGGYVQFDYTHNRPVNVVQKSTHTPTIDWPLDWRGYVSEPDIEYRFPAVGLKDYYSQYATNKAGIIDLIGQGILQTGLSKAIAGDIVIWDRDVLWSTKPMNPTDLTVTEYDILNEVMGDWRNQRPLSNSNPNGDADFQGSDCGGEGENDRRISEDDPLGEGSGVQEIMIPIENSRLPHVAFVSNAHTVGALYKKWQDAEKKCSGLWGGMMKMAECDAVEHLKAQHDALAADTSKEWIEITEANFGKNPDICGNTDRWGMKSTRRIYKERKSFAMTSVDIADSEGSCSDPENRNCHEALWDRVKVYHVGRDLRHSPKK